MHSRLMRIALVAMLSVAVATFTFGTAKAQSPAPVTPDIPVVTPEAPSIVSFGAPLAIGIGVLVLASRKRSAARN